MKHVQRCGFFFSLPAPPDSVLLSMKISALLARVQINSAEELKKAILNKLQETDLNIKRRDFEHLLFNSNAGDKILMFAEFINHNL